KGVIKIMGHPAGQLAQGAELFRLDELALRIAQLLVGSPQTLEITAVRDRRSQQVRYQVEKLDLGISEAGWPGADTLQDPNGLIAPTQRYGKRAIGAARCKSLAEGVDSLFGPCQVRIEGCPIAQAGFEWSLLQPELFTPRQ